MLASIHPLAGNRAPFSRALWLVAATEAYSGCGADVVMESVHK
jgi:hypothetical protein